MNEASRDYLNDLDAFQLRELAMVAIERLMELGEVLFDDVTADEGFYWTSSGDALFEATE